MLTVEGNYKNGKIELAEKPGQISESKVLVTFLDAGTVDLRARGLAENEAADLRARLKTFAEDWERPETAVYD